MEVLQPALGKRAHNIWLIHKAITYEHRIEAFSSFVDFKAPLVGHMRDVFGFDLHQNHALVQHLVVFQGVKQHDRDWLRSRVMKIAVPDTRISDCGLRSRRNKGSGSASRARISAINRLPRHHVPMTVNAKVAAIIGNQPPSTTFNKLALKNNISTIANMLNNGTRSQIGHLAPEAKYVKPRIVSTAIVPVTATP